MIRHPMPLSSATNYRTDLRKETLKMRDPMGDRHSVMGSI